MNSDRPFGLVDYICGYNVGNISALDRMGELLYIKMEKLSVSSYKIPRNLLDAGRIYFLNKCIDRIE